MHRAHAGYTVLAPLRAGTADAASQRLATFNQDLATHLPFAATTTTLFAMAAVIPAQTWRGEELPAALLLATSFSGPADEHLTDLVEHAGSGLRAVLADCTDFRVDCADHELEAFLVRHRRADTFYSGMHHLSREDLGRHDELRLAIERFVVDRDVTGESPSAIHRAIQAHVRAQPALAWAQESWRPTATAWLAQYGHSLLAGAAILGMLATMIASCFVGSSLVQAIAMVGYVGLGVLLVLFGGFVMMELRETHVAGRPPDAKIRALAETQCHPVLNEMTIAGPVKAGWAVPWILRITLWIVARAATIIDIPTVATARWIAADGGRRLIFISNFTNMSEPYVRDFIDTKAGARKINLTFGFGHGYPRTRLLYFAGAAADSNGFVNVVNTNQRPTELWYCPYTHLSIDNIRRNRRIREGLFRPASDDTSPTWLRDL